MFFGPHNFVNQELFEDNFLQHNIGKSRVKPGAFLFLATYKKLET